MSVCLYPSPYLSVGVRVSVYARSRPAVTELLPARLLRHRVVRDDVIAAVQSRDPRTCRVRYG